MTTTRNKSSACSPKEFFGRMLQAAFPDAVPEHQFHPRRKWRLDWYLPRLSVGIEIEGGVWISGRHTRPSGFMKDMEKYNTAALMGVKVYRISHTDLRSVEKILEHLTRIKRYAAA